MKIRIVTRDNGWGLSKDVAVLAEAIKLARPDAEVTFAEWLTRPPDRVDVQFFLELLPGHLFGLAGRNVAVPNPEWFMADFSRHLHSCSEVWAKTDDCADIFRPLAKRVEFTGWTSPDRFDGSVARKKRMVHLAGNSSAKGTAQVMDAMRLLPDLNLMLVSAREWLNLPGNVEHRRRLEDGEFAQLQNEATIHLCPSSYEGFGHYLNEARSCGALIITTAAAPMNELVHPSFGIGAKPAQVSRQNLATHKHVSVESLADCIRAAWSAPDDVVSVLGGRARNAYLADRDQFHERVKALLQ
jgi:hypothetical protein